MLTLSHGLCAWMYACVCACVCVCVCVRVCACVCCVVCASEVSCEHVSDISHPFLHTVTLTSILHCSGVRVLPFSHTVWSSVSVTTPAVKSSKERNTDWFQLLLSYPL